MAIKKVGFDASDVLGNKKLQRLQFHYVPGGNITITFKSIFNWFFRPV